MAAFSKTVRPTSILPLSHDPQRIAFWFRLHEAWKAGWADELVPALGSMKICFVFCPSEEAAESKKWELAARSDTLAECAVLRGWKRLLGVVHLKKQLSAWCVDSSDEAAPQLNSKMTCNVVMLVFA